MQHLQLVAIDLYRLHALLHLGQQRVAMGKAGRIGQHHSIDLFPALCAKFTVGQHSHIAGDRRIDRIGRNLIWRTFFVQIDSLFIQTGLHRAYSAGGAAGPCSIDLNGAVGRHIGGGIHTLPQRLRQQEGRFCVPVGQQRHFSVAVAHIQRKNGGQRNIMYSHSICPPVLFFFIRNSSGSNFH